MADTASPMIPHILIVDDERSIREPLSEYLEGHGFRVKGAASADAARTLLATNHFDLIICDIMMPGEDGLSLTRHIRERGDIPVILLTARTEDTERIVGLEMGADDYLGKPFNPRELVARSKAVLRRTSLAGERVNGDAGESFVFGDWVLKATERALILSIHQLKDAERICDRLLLLAAGRRLGFGTLTELAVLAGVASPDLEEVFLGLTE